MAEPLRMTLGRHYANDPEFYCHGEACIANGHCSPLFCIDESERAEHAPDDEEA